MAIRDVEWSKGANNKIDEVYKEKSDKDDYTGGATAIQFVNDIDHAENQLENTSITHKNVGNDTYEAIINNIVFYYKKKANGNIVIVGFFLPGENNPFK